MKFLETTLLPNKLAVLWLVTLLGIVAFKPTGLVADEAQPQTQYEILGTKILSPNEPNWDVTTATFTDLVLFKRGPEPGETTAIVASVLNLPDSSSDQRLLQFVKSAGEEGNNYGEDPNRFVLLSANEELVPFKGLMCVKYHRTFQDLMTTAVDAVGPQYLKDLGWICRDPGHSGLSVQITFSNRSGALEVEPSSQAVADLLFSNVQFSESMWVEDFSVGLAAAQAGDFERARAVWWPLANLGDLDSQFNLGILYFNGYGVQQDLAEAAYWYRMAADQGNAQRAEFELGRMYSEGNGVPQDHAEAVRWYRLSAEQGYARAQVALGVKYYHGEGVPRDYTEAVRWYLLAAKQGNTRAQIMVGLLYADGRGVPQDLAESARWIRIAAEQGDASAQTYLGDLYNNGRGVPRDVQTAYMWFDIGSANGNELSGNHRDAIAEKMTFADISEAQDRAHVCIASNYQDCD